MAISSLFTNTNNLLYFHFNLIVEVMIWWWTHNKDQFKIEEPAWFWQSFVPEFFLQGDFPPCQISELTDFMENFINFNATFCLSWRAVAVFRIHGILVWIRIRIRGSTPLTNGSGSGCGSRCGSGSCYFRHWPSGRQHKVNYKKISAYYFLKVHLHHFSKIKSPNEVTKQ